MKVTTLIALVFTCLVACSSVGISDASNSSLQVETPLSELKPLYLADPFILTIQDCYYAYGTNSSDGIEVYMSKDLVRWTGPCGRCEQGLALHKDNSTAIDRFWAPEVYRKGDKYIMVFSGSERARIAEADSPLGPFVEKAVYTPDQSSIDDHIFVDEDGTPYLYWVRFGLGKGNEIRVARLSDDWFSIVSEQVECIHAQEDWELRLGKVTEGPFVLKHDGLYYLTYSANDFRSQDYSVGYAVSSSPLGPWVRYEGNPILRRPGKYIGSGHHAFFKDHDGNLKIVFHVHNSADRVEKRKMLIAPVRFVKESKSEAAVLVVDTENLYVPMKQD